MSPPYNLGLSTAARFRNEEPNLASKGKIGTDNGHAAGMAHVDGDAIRPAGAIVFVPFDLKSQAGDGAFMGAQFGPAVFHCLLGAIQEIQS